MPGRWAIVLTGVIIAFSASARPSGQAPALKDVLKLSAAYVERFQQQLSQIVSEETYAQTVVNTSRLTNSMLLLPSRTLQSDLILVKSAEENRFVELRDVFEVDGTPVRDRQARLEQLLGANSTAAGSQIAAIIKESARYNVGTIQRNVNTPLLALMFLLHNYQDRFTFKHVTKETPVFKESGDREFNEAPVFRVSTEMWTIEYPGAQERHSDPHAVGQQPPGARTVLDRSVDGCGADQRDDRRRRRRDRHRHGELPVGAVDGISRTRRNARVVSALRRTHYRARGVWEVPPAETVIGFPSRVTPAPGVAR